MATKNPHHITKGVKSPLVKVLEILKNFFKKFLSGVRGKAPRSFHFYPVAERGDSRANSVDGIGLVAAGIRRVSMATKNPRHITKGVKSPLVKVLESLENFFQEVFK